MSATKREQQPFVNGSLSKEAIYLKPSEATSTPAVAVLPATNAKPAAVEQEVGKDPATPPDDNKWNAYTAEDAQRVEAFATELNLKMPPFSIGETKANVPASAARFVGIWSSKIGFGDGKGRCAMLIVTEVISGTSDLALGFYLWGPPTKLSWEKNEQAGYVGFAGNITEGSHNHPARDPRALAQSRLSLLLALEVAPTGRATADRTELRRLVRRMSVENPLWGAPRIHGELLKLGFEVAQSSVAKYMVKRRGPPSQGWRTFSHNHAPDITAMDLFVVPTIGFDLLYAFVIVRLGRRDLVWINVTAYPTVDWIARQIAEAFPWNEAPRYMIRDRDRIFGTVVTRRLRAMGIRDKPTAPASPWQNGVVELDPARERRSYDRPGRGASTSHPEILRPLLQRNQNASVFEQGCARLSLGTAHRCHLFTRHPWRTSSPL
jgi:hypothetical protein